MYLSTYISDKAHLQMGACYATEDTLPATNRYLLLQCGCLLSQCGHNLRDNLAKKKEGRKEFGREFEKEI